MIISPEKNEAYTTTDVKLDFIINRGGQTGFTSMEITYGLDGQKYEKFSGWLRYTSAFSNCVGYLYILNNLTVGIHSVQATVSISGRYWASGHLMKYAFTKSSSIIYFAVNTEPSTVSVSSLDGIASYGAGIEVKYSVNKDVSWLGYSLNGQDFVELNKEGLVDYSIGPRALRRGNFTLSELPAADYTLVIYAKDLSGNVDESEAFQFTVGLEAQPETRAASELPFPTTFVTASLRIAAAIGVGAGLMVYFKKRKR